MNKKLAISFKICYTVGALYERDRKEKQHANANVYLLCISQCATSNLQEMIK